MPKLMIAGQVFESYTETFKFTNEEILKLETTYSINDVDVTKDEFFTKMNSAMVAQLAEQSHELARLRALLAYSGIVN